jgi:hypothetical protein
MPRYQKISSNGSITTFRVISDSGLSEVRSSVCLSGETEDQMMSRHAHHHNDELIAARARLDAALLAAPGQERAAIAKDSLPIRP